MSGLQHQGWGGSEITQKISDNIPTPLVGEKLEDLPSDYKDVLSHTKEGNKWFFRELIMPQDYLALDLQHSNMSHYWESNHQKFQ